MSTIKIKRNFDITALETTTLDTLTEGELGYIGGDYNNLYIGTPDGNNALINPITALDLKNEDNQLKLYKQIKQGQEELLAAVDTSVFWVTATDIDMNSGTMSVNKTNAEIAEAYQQNYTIGLKWNLEGVDFSLPLIMSISNDGINLACFANFMISPFGDDTAPLILLAIISGDQGSFIMAEIASAEAIQNHIEDTSNPHNVTKSQIGLGSVENKSSATIRSEITKENVTTALGYTPLESDRLFVTLTPTGTEIKTSGTDLNQVNYLKVGRYYCRQNDIAETLINCPTTLAFMMEVYAPLATQIDDEDGAWKYRLRKITTHKGQVYYQPCNSNGTAGNWIYNPWFNADTRYSAGTGVAIDSNNEIQNKAATYFIGSNDITTTAGTSKKLSTKWKVNNVQGISTPFDGMHILVRVPSNVGVTTAGTVLSIDNGTTYYPVVYNKNTVITSHYSAGSTIILTFNATQTATAYLTSGTSTTVTGCWQAMEYNSNTTYSAGTGLNLSSTTFSLKTAGADLGGVKTTSTVSDATGYTATPIIDGVPYYKNTTYTTRPNPNALTIKGAGTAVETYTGSAVGEVDIVGGSNVTVTGEDGKITISASNTNSDYVSKSNNSIQTIAGGLVVGKDSTSGVAGTGKGRLILTGQTNPLIGLQATVDGKQLDPYYMQALSDGTMCLGPTAAKALSFDSDGNMSSPANLSMSGDISSEGDITADNGTISGKEVIATKFNNTATIGSATNPIYINSDGVPDECTYELNATVPSDAKFTDTWKSATTSEAGTTIVYKAEDCSSYTSNYTVGGQAETVTPLAVNKAVHKLSLTGDVEGSFEANATSVWAMETEVKHADEASKVTNALTIGDNKTFDGSSAVTITAGDLGISSALKYKGKTTDVTTIKNPEAGDVYSIEDANGILTGQEKAYTGSEWIDLGDEKSYALKTIKIEGGDGLKGGGNLTENQIIKPNLKDFTQHSADSTALTNTSSRQYAVGLDKSGYLSVNIPWTDTNTKMYVYRQTSGYNNNYPLLVSRTAASSIGTAGTNGGKTAVYGVFREDENGNPTLLANPAAGSITATTFIGNVQGKADAAEALAGTQSASKVPLSSPTQGQIVYYYNVNTGLEGNMPNTSNNANGILTINTHNGNYYHQLGFNNKGEIYHRSADGSALTNESAWSLMLDANNYKDYALPLTGGEMQGPITINGGDAANVSKIILDPSKNGQITDNGTSTILGFTASDQLTIGHASYKTQIRGANPIALQQNTQVNGNLAVTGTTNITGKLTASGDADITGNTTIGGTLTLSKTQDAAGKANNSPALIVGGTATTAHIEIDNNEILAKSDGTNPTTLNLNTDGGAVVAGGAFTATSLKSTGGLTIGDSITYLNGDYTDKTIVQLWTGDNNSCGIAIGGGGPVIIGGGESAGAYKTNTSLAASSEEATYITADKSIYFFPNCDTIANRVGAIFDTSRNFYPIDKDKGKANETGSLGLADAKWGATYVKNANITTLNVSGNTTLGDAATDTTTLNGPTIKNAGTSSNKAHLYLDGAKGASADNTTQIVFREGSTEHYAISSNDDCFVINKNSSATDSQIALYLGDKAATNTSNIPSKLQLPGLTVTGNSTLGDAVSDITTINGKARIIANHSDKDALTVTGGVQISNTLRLGSTTSNPAFESNWCEGIRINAADSTWVTIALGTTAESNTNTNCWSIHRTNTNDFNISKNSSNGVNGLVMTDTGMGLGIATPDSRLHVNGTAKVTGATNIGDTLTAPRILLNRHVGPSNGRISFYNSTYTTWYEYMSQPDAGFCPTGGKPVTYGDVTSWARRSLIEHNSGYGWVWEACANGAAANNTTTPTAIMSLSSNTGKLAVSGPIVGATSLSVGTTASITGLITQGSPASDTSINTMNRFQADLFVEGNGSAPNEPVKPGFYLGKSAEDENRHMDIVSGGDYSYIDFNKASVKEDYRVRLIANVTSGLTEMQWASGATNKKLSIDGALNVTGNATVTGTTAFSGQVTASGTVDIRGTAASQPLKVRGIVGSDGNGTVDALYLQYGANKPVYFGNAGGYTISADGSNYSGNSATATTADTAAKFTSAAGITLTGDVTGTASSQHGWSIATTVGDDSHNHTWLLGTKVGSTVPIATPAAGRIVYAYNVNTGSAGHMPNVSNNANGILTLNTHDGNYYHQLGFNNRGEIYHRSADGTALTNSSAWTKVAKVTDKVAAATNADYATNAGNAATSSMPLGFASRTTGATWGNTTGTSFTCWNDPSGGSIDFRQDNPSSGKVSIKVDGRVYVNEGNNPVLSSQHANGYWGICTPDGDNTDWIRTTINGLIPYQAGGHGSLGTSGWPFSTVYAHNFHGYLNGNISGSSTSCSGNAKGLYQSGFGDGNLTYYQTSSSFAGSVAQWASYIICNHGNGETYYSQMIRLPFGHESEKVPQYQYRVGGTLQGWKYFLTETNYSNYALPLSGGTMSGALNMNNNSISNIGELTFNDPGAGEGITWTGGNGWKIYESPDDLSNAAGNLQFVHNSTRRLTLRTDGTINTNGVLELANGTWNKAGDDAYFGDNNTAGSFAIKGINGITNLKMVTHGADTYGTMSWDGSNFVFSHAIAGTRFAAPGISSSWWNGRDNAIYRVSSASGYTAAMSIKSTNGSFEIGHYNASGWHDQLLVNYKSDTSYSSGGSANSVQHLVKISPDQMQLLAPIISTSGFEVANDSLYVRAKGFYTNLQSDTGITAVPNARIQTDSGTYGRLRLTSNSNSSRLIKDNIESLSNEDIKADNLYNLPVYQFKYKKSWIQKEDCRYDITLPGFIIEEMDEIYPVAVDKNSDSSETWGWNTQYLLPPMLKLIQDQKKQLDTQQMEIDELKELVNKLLEKLS